MSIDARLETTVRAIRSLPTNVIADWGRSLARTLSAGKRLLLVGNGGSSSQAQHLAAELVGRYRQDRQPYSALALGDPCSLTAIGNDYDFGAVFARQVEAHGREGDILLCLSTSGRSGNVLQAVRVAQTLGLVTWALTGPAPNPLSLLTAESISVDAAIPAVVQEVHQVALHLLCERFEDVLSHEPQHYAFRG